MRGKKFDKENRMKASKFWLIVLAGLLTSSAYADSVRDWNENAGKAAIATCISPIDDPLHESRLYAMMHLAIHDALNAIDRRSEAYVYHVQAASWASPEAAVAAAARDVLVNLISQIPFPFPATCISAGLASVEADYTLALAGIPNSTAKTEGISIGQAAAAAILALRANDGSNTPLLDFNYPQGTNPGEYRFTPGFNFAFAPGWGNVKPFVLTHSSQFTPTRPYEINTTKYVLDFDEVKALGGNGVTTPSARTIDQTEIALFWIESSPLQWNRIARTASAILNLDMWENARLFGLLNMAMADGYISSFNAKYRYNYWRPITAIQTADTDGNPETAADPTWTSLVPAPPIPDHDSAHSVQGGAAAEVMKDFFRTDDIAFTTCSLTLPAGRKCTDASPVLRHYSNFSQAADENGVSRILVGFHFRNAVEEGIRHGRRIGERAVNLFLRQVH
jgi:hypothetical protein